MAGRHSRIESTEFEWQPKEVELDGFDIPFWERCIELSYKQLLTYILVTVVILTALSWLNNRTMASMNEYHDQQIATESYQEGYIKGYDDGANAYLKGELS